VETKSIFQKLKLREITPGNEENISSIEITPANEITELKNMINTFSSEIAELKNRINRLEEEQEKRMNEKKDE
jgi:hypothetical protein